MYPFPHAMFGLLTGELAKNKKKIALIVGILLGILPDFDFIFNMIKNYTGLSFSFLMHRNITHTIFPAAFLVGFATLYFFRSYWMGFLAIGFHWLLDVLDGGAIPFFPGINFEFKYSLVNMIPNYRFVRWSGNTAGFNDIVMSAITGTILLLIVIGIEVYLFYSNKDEE